MMHFLLVSGTEKSVTVSMGNGKPDKDSHKIDYLMNSILGKMYSASDPLLRLTLQRIACRNSCKGDSKRNLLHHCPSQMHTRIVSCCRYTLIGSNPHLRETGNGAPAFRI